MDWDAQKAIWDGLFSTEVFNVSSVSIAPTSGSEPRNQIDTTQASLLLTEPYFNLPNIRNVYDQFVFEEYEFQSYFRCTRGLLF